MKKQINMIIEKEEVFVYMNTLLLFKLSSTNKSIDIQKLYSDLNVSKEDFFENIIEPVEKDNKNTIENIYCNAKIFLDDLINKINDVIVNFDEAREVELLKYQ